MPVFTLIPRWKAPKRLYKAPGRAHFNRLKSDGLKGSERRKRDRDKSVREIKPRGADLGVECLGLLTGHIKGWN